MDSRLAALQQVILKKDLALLDLQTRLDAYRARYGELEPEGDAAAPADNPIAAAVAAAEQLQSAKSAKSAKSGRERSPSSSGSLPSWLTRATRASSSASRGQATPKPGRDASCSEAEAEAPCSDRSGSDNGSGSGSGGSDGVARATGRHVVLDFVADSPMSRRQLESFDEALAGLRVLLRELQARCKEFVAAGERFGEDEAALADELVARRHARALFTTSVPQLGSLSSAFHQVRDTLAQVQRSRVSMLHSVEALLQRALEELADQELKDALDMRKEVARLGDEYEAQLAKLLAKPRALSSAGNSSSGGSGGPASTPSASASAPSSSSSSLMDAVPGLAALASPSVAGLADAAAGSSAAAKQQRSLERDALGARLRFELARFDLVRTLNGLEARKKLALLECADSTLYALLSHFHACHELVKAVEPALRARQDALQTARRELEADDGMWAAQRETLDLRLRADLERLLASADATPTSSSAGSGSGGGAFAGSGTMPTSMDLPVEVVSRETWSGAPAAADGAEPTAEAAGVTKQGFLFVRSSLFPARSWKRRWFQIRDGKLYQHRGGRQQHMDVALVCDLLLARVREVGDASSGAASAPPGSSSASASAPSSASTSASSGAATSLPFCFEVIDASQARHLLQATSEREMRSWVDAAQRSTAAMLERQAHGQEEHPEQQAAVAALLARNPACADCGARPADWVSINIGCLLCIECSGIHRSLGVHESKVRSLALDSWDMALLALLRDRLGNAAVNAAWESHVPRGWTRPTPQAPRDDKAKWITAKYHAHAFVSPVDAQTAVERFLTAAAAADMDGLVDGLAHGVDVNARRADGARESALHLAARAGDADCCDYLVLNGASLSAADASGSTASATAATNGHARLAQTLALKDER